MQGSLSCCVPRSDCMMETATTVFKHWVEKNLRFEKDPTTRTMLCKGYKIAGPINLEVKEFEGKATVKVDPFEFRMAFHDSVGVDRKLAVSSLEEVVRRL